MFKLSFAGAALAACAFAANDIAWTPAGRFDFKHPAFARVQKFEDSEEFLLVSQFSALAPGHIKMVTGIKDAVVNNTVEQLTETNLRTSAFTWPNDIRVIPKDVFGFNAIVVPDGFLVPGHSDGGVYVVQMMGPTSVKRTVPISDYKQGYFYHMGEWIDMNGDGLKDFVTARSNALPGGGELVWFEHPVGGLDVSPW